MRCWILFGTILLMGSPTLAQIAPTPTPTPRPGSRQAAAGPIAADNTNFDRLRSIELMTRSDRPASHPLLDLKSGIYRRPNKNEIEVLAVSEPVRSQYAVFLKQQNTGIVKLSAESSCISDTDVLVATEKCLPFKIPGAGTAYSFRTESYRLPRLADLILFDGVFRTGGVYQLVVMVELGDVAVDDVSLATKGMKYLVDLVPVRDSDKFMEFNDATVKGFVVDDFLYRKGHPVKNNVTYALRSIAYRGRFMRGLDGITYDELEFDRRRDVIATFRVVERDAAGNTTIVWKLLKDLEAPKLNIKK